MSYELKNGNVSVDLIWGFHFNTSFNQNFKSKVGESIKIYSIKIKVEGQKGCYLKVNEWYCKPASFVKEIKGYSAKYNLILDPKRIYEIYCKIQSEERLFMKVSGAQLIDYFSEMERERERYKNNEEKLKLSNVLLESKEKEKEKYEF